MQPNRPDQLGVGVTYWPADVGPYLWHEFHPATVIRDLTAIASRRIPVVRVMLSWDVFMPSDRAPNGRRMRDLETLLNAARDVGIRVVITLFAQSLGDCVRLPAYAIDRRAPRPGVRCLTDARAVDGGPRDIYADPLMLEVQVRWLDAMLAGVPDQPCNAAWSAETGARAVDGGPRDIYPAPLMLEVQVRWLAAMLAGFAHPPAIAA